MTNRQIKPSKNLLNREMGPKLLHTERSRSNATKNLVAENTPGPGHYNPPTNHISQEIPLIYRKYASENNKKLAFGSTIDRDIHFVKRDVQCPYVNKTSFETPALGTYNLLS